MYTPISASCGSISTQECLSRAIDACSAYSNPFEACFREGLTLFWGGSANFWAPGVLSLLISFFIIAIAYMLAEFLRSPELNAWVKRELYEVAVSAVIFGAVIASLLVMNNFVSPLVAHGKTHIQVGEEYLNETLDDLKVTYLRLLVFDASMGTLGSIGTSFHIPFFGVGGMALWGTGFSPLAGLGQVTNAVVTIADFIAVVLINLWAQIALLDFVKNSVITLLLPFSLLLRTFPITRRLGSTMIAFCIALYVVYPLTLALDKGMYEHGLHALNLDKYEFTNTGSTFEDYQAAANLNGADAADAFPKVFLNCPSKTLEKDADYPFIFTIAAPKATPQADIFDDDGDGDVSEMIAGTYEVYVTKVGDAAGPYPPYMPTTPVLATESPYDWPPLLGSEDCKGIFLNDDYLPKECTGEFEELGEYNVTVKIKWAEDSILIPGSTFDVTDESRCTVKVVEPAGHWSFVDWLKRASGWSAGGLASSVGIPIKQIFGSALNLGSSALGLLSPNFMVSTAYDFLTCDDVLVNDISSSCYTSLTANGIAITDPSWSLPVVMSKTTFVLVLTVVSIIISITFFRSISTSLGGESSLAGLSKII
ncbi:hypothetical protein HY992_00455 [Candidatus Micrarchaeota archaeon]|nr:hypothetical protein [Candidatus Micrarchaeota archaeon]